MTQKGGTNHYNVKFLKGYGFSIKVKDSKIILKNCSDPFKEPEVEEWFVKNMPYEKIVMSGKGYISTEALSLLSQHHRNLILVDTYGRAQLYRFVVEHDIEREVVAFATDSICCTKKLEVDSDKLGEFSFEGSADDIFFLQNGFYRKNGTWKQRGFGKLSGKDIEHLETFEKNGKLFYKIKVLRNSRLRTSIIQNQISEIGKIKEVVKQFNLNADRKRLWLGKIESIDLKVMNESMPISLNHLDKMHI